MRYVVLNGHTLGIIRPERPDRLEILHASILRGSTYNMYSDSVVIGQNDVLVDATVQDFESFRVSPIGHILKNDNP